jgi:tetratricopeptide (TPR) repeat protein
MVEATLPRRASARRLSTLLITAVAQIAAAAPYTPVDDSTVLATIPASARHTSTAVRHRASERLDVALPLARLYIQEARSSGDLRFLGYAEATLAPWVGSDSSADALVLQATIQQSRHDFAGALDTLQQALVLQPENPQAWLTSATVLRVLGRFDEARGACRRLSLSVGPAVMELCSRPVDALSGSLAASYERVRDVSSQGLPNDERAWRDSELGEMAVRLGREAEAEHWFKNGLQFSPDDFYIRAAYADLLLRQERAREALALLQGRESLEPLLLRVALAQKDLREPGLAESRARLAAAFASEAQRGEGIHRREESRFLLDVMGDTRGALRAALANWQVQHEVDDVLILIRAAQAAGEPSAAAPAMQFVRQHTLEDVRIAAALEHRS